MPNAIVYEDQGRIASGDPATHAIVIGVGDYPHLNGGTEDRTQLHGNLQQLSSPPVSAFTVANWLLDDFSNPDKPLASVSLLVSSAGKDQFKHAKLAAPVTPLTATAANVKAAVKDWFKLADTNEQNMTLLFFCGHGVARGIDGLTLLLTDYGEDDTMPMDGAMDFAALHRGMAQCRASEQCFFVDACRKVSDIATHTTATGQTFIQDNINRPHSSDWKYAIFYSTLEGEAAYGRRDKPSFYTDELIKGLSGAGAHNRASDGKWRVSTGLLNSAVHRGLSLRGKKIKIPMAAQVEFDFHLLPGPPVVPVTVFCDPRSDNSRAELSYGQNGSEIDRRPPDASDWATDVPYGVYDFQAAIGPRNTARPGEPILPPYREISLVVPP